MFHFVYPQLNVHSVPRFPRLYVYILILTAICSNVNCNTSSPASRPKPLNPKDTRTKKNLLKEDQKAHIDSLLFQMAADEYKTRKSATKQLCVLLTESGENKRLLLEYLQNYLEKSEDTEIRCNLGNLIEVYLKPWEYFKKLRLCKGHTSYITAVEFSPDGTTFVSASRDKTIRVWDFRTGECVKTLTGHEGPVKSIAFSPDSKILASASFDSTIRIWNLHTGACMQILKGHIHHVNTLAFSPDGELLASGGSLWSVRLWNIRTGDCRAILKGEGSVYSVAFSPDGKLLASGDAGRSILIWDPKTAKLLKRIKGHDGAVFALRFNPKNSLLASASQDTTIIIWNPIDGTKLRKLSGHQTWVKCLSFSSDCSMLVSCTGDSIRLWSTNTGRCLRIIEENGLFPSCVTFCPNNISFVSGYGDGKIIIWGIPEE